MIGILTALLCIMFVVQYITQSTHTLRRLNTASRIRTGRLSYRDIVSISHQRYTAKQWYPCLDNIRAEVSARFYLSSNGRLYKRIRINSHITVKYFSYQNALDYIIEEHSHVKVLITTRSLSYATFYRPMAACI